MARRAKSNCFGFPYVLGGWKWLQHGAGWWITVSNIDIALKEYSLSTILGNIGPSVFPFFSRQILFFKMAISVFFTIFQAISVFQFSIALFSLLNKVFYCIFQKISLFRIYKSRTECLVV